MITVEKIAELSGHQNPIFTAEGSQKKGILFTAGNDKGVVEWSLKRMEFIKVIVPVKSSVYALHSVVAKPVLVIGERSGLASVFDFEQQKITARLNYHQLPVFDIASVPGKDELILASEDGTVSVWSLLTFERIYTFPVSGDTVRIIAISPDNTLIAFGCKDHQVRVFSLEDYTLAGVLQDHTLPVTSLQFSPDGNFLLSGSRDAQLKIWNVSDLTLKQSVAAHLFTIYDIKYHPVLPVFATASRDKSIKIWSADDFRLLKTISREKGYEMHHLSVNKILWETLENRLVSVGDDKLVMVWKVDLAV